MAFLVQKLTPKLLLRLVGNLAAPNLFSTINIVIKLLQVLRFE